MDEKNMTEENEINLTDVLVGVSNLEESIDNEIEISNISGEELTEKLLDTVKDIGLGSFYYQIVNRLCELAREPFNILYPVREPDDYEKRRILLSILSCDLELNGVKFSNHPKFDFKNMPGYEKWKKFCGDVSAILIESDIESSPTKPLIKENITRWIKSEDEQKIIYTDKEGREYVEVKRGNL